ncbi:MAG TPA: nucleoside-diphosphate kinase, partial [Candidatus Xenobia bacterium]
MEKTLILFKPDAVQRGLIGQILSAIEAKGFRILGLKLVQLTRDKAEEHYAPHKGKGFFNDVCTYMTSGPVVALIVGGHNAIKGMRQLVGATDPGQADPGSIRGRWAQTIDKNLIHGSDSQESSDREIPIFFSKAEIL